MERMNDFGSPKLKCQKRMIRADLAETLETMPSNIEQEKEFPNRA